MELETIYWKKEKKRKEKKQKFLERLQKFGVFILWLVAEKLKERKIES